MTTAPAAPTITIRVKGAARPRSEVGRVVPQKTGKYAGQSLRVLSQKETYQSARLSEDFGRGDGPGWLVVLTCEVVS